METLDLGFIGLLIAIFCALLIIGMAVWDKLRNGDVEAQNQQPQKDEDPTFMSGLLNPYSGTLLVIWIVLLVSGTLFLIGGSLWGLVPFTLGVLMTQGFSWPSEAAPSKVWLITFFGQMTEVRVYGLTFLLDWLPGLDIVGHVEFVLEQKDMDIKLLKDVYCNGDKAYITGELSISVLPDDQDDKYDPRYPGAMLLTGGKKLKAWKNIGEWNGIKKQLDDILTDWVQHEANEPGRTSLELEINEDAVGHRLLAHITGKLGRRGEVLTSNNSIDDTRNFGASFPKFTLILRAVDKVREARTNVVVQQVNRQGHLEDTQNVNYQIAERLRLYHHGKKDSNTGEWLIKPTPEHLIPTMEAVRDMIVEENLMDQEKLTGILNKGGVTLANVNTNQTK